MRWTTENYTGAIAARSRLLGVKALRNVFACLLIAWLLAACATHHANSPAVEQRPAKPADRRWWNPLAWEWNWQDFEGETFTVGP